MQFWLHKSFFESYKFEDIQGNNCYFTYYKMRNIITKLSFLKKLKKAPTAHTPRRKIVVSNYLPIPSDNSFNFP